MISERVVRRVRDKNCRRPFQGHIQKNLVSVRAVAEMLLTSTVSPPRATTLLLSEITSNVCWISSDLPDWKTMKKERADTAHFKTKKAEYMKTISTITLPIGIGGNLPNGGESYFTPEEETFICQDLAGWVDLAWVTGG